MAHFFKKNNKKEIERSNRVNEAPNNDEEMKNQEK